MTYEVCLISLIGLPAAGKSSFCQWLLAEARKQHQIWPYSIIYYCYDDYLTIPTNVDIVEFNYKAQRAGILEQLQTIIQKLKNAELMKDVVTFESKVSNKLLFICDDNHYYRSMRYKLFQLARREELAYGQIFFNCSLDMALKRNALRNGKQSLPNSVLADMFERLELPLSEKYTFELNTFQYEVETDKSKLLEFILNSFNNKINRIEEDISTTNRSQSTIHQLDILLRKRLKEMLDSFDGSNKAFRAKELNEKRKQIINLFKNSENKLELEMESFYVNMLY